jgi:hypothetical protein
MKIRYNVDPKASKNKPADKVVTVDRALFSRFKNRNYIIRNPEIYSTIKTIKFICKQNRESRYFELVHEIRHRFQLRKPEEWDF